MWHIWKRDANNKQSHNSLWCQIEGLRGKRKQGKQLGCTGRGGATGWLVREGIGAWDPGAETCPQWGIHPWKCFQESVPGRAGRNQGLCCRGKERCASQNSHASIVSHLDVLPGEHPPCPGKHSCLGVSKPQHTDLLGGVNLCLEGCLVHCKLFNSISDLYPLDTSSTCPPVTTEIPFPSPCLALCFFALILCRCSQLQIRYIESILQVLSRLLDIRDPGCTYISGYLWRRMCKKVVELIRVSVPHSCTAPSMALSLVCIHNSVPIFLKWVPQIYKL